MVIEITYTPVETALPPRPTTTWKEEESPKRILTPQTNIMCYGDNQETRNVNGSSVRSVMVRKWTPKSPDQS